MGTVVGDYEFHCEADTLYIVWLIAQDRKNSDVQSQTDVTDYLKSQQLRLFAVCFSETAVTIKQLLLFVFAQGSTDPFIHSTMP